MEKPEDGWVEWLENNAERKGLRLVHHKPASPLNTKHGCQYDEKQEHKNTGSLLRDLPLTYFLGENGLMHLLSMLAAKKIPQEEIVELIKRLHVSGYEQARPYFKEVISLGIVEPNLPDGFYHEQQIKAVLEALERGEFGE